ncbi:MAG: hypothetical protein ACFFCO_07745 [Promethearchaeota archaeon]
MSRRFGAVDPRIFVRAAMARLVEQSRGPARPLALAAVDQVPQLMTLGMTPSAALRESLRTTIVAARLRARHCIGTERFAFDDLVNLCQETEARLDLMT